MKKNRMIKSIVAVIALFAMLFSMAACSKAPEKAPAKTPEERFENVQQSAIDAMLKSVDSYYANLEAYDPNNINIKANLKVRLGSSLLSMLSSMADMDFEWINDLGIAYEQNIKDDTLGMALGLNVNDKELLSADAMLDMATSNMYLAIPVLAEQYLKLNLAEAAGAEVDFSAIMAQMDYSKILPEKDQVKKLINKYHDIVMKSVSSVEESNDSVSALEVSQECLVYEVKMTQKQLGELAIDLLKALSEDEVVKDMIESMADYVNGVNSTAGLEDSLDAEEMYDELVSEIEAVIEDIEDTDLTDDEMLKWTTYATKDAEVLGYKFRLTNEDDETIELVAVSAQDGENIGQELYVEYDDEKVFAVEGELTEEENVLEGTYEVLVEGETLMFVDLEDVDTKQLEAGIFDGSISISPSKELVSLITDELGTDAFAGLSISAASIKIDVEQSEKDAAKVTVSLMNGTEEFVAIIIDCAVSEGESATTPANSTEDAEQWAQGFDFNALGTAIQESDLPDDVVELIGSLLVQMMG